MSGLPAGWSEAHFGEINRFVSRTFDPSGSPSEQLELYSVPSFPSGSPELLAGNAIGSSKQVVEPADVLVCKINPRINRVWQVMPKTARRQIASSEWIVMRAPELDSRFLRHFFSTQAFRELICQDVTGVGGSLTRAQPKRVATFKVPIAPLPEQIRIADKLDALLARVDACRERLDRVPLLLKRFRQAVLAAATSGELTEEWRAQDSVTGPFRAHFADVEAPSGIEGLGRLPPTWHWVRFGELLTSFRSGTSAVPQNEPTGFPVLRSSSVRQGSVDFADVRYLPPGYTPREDDFLLDGDLLFTRLSGSLEYVANCALVRNLASRKIHYPDRLFRARIGIPSAEQYLEYCFGSPSLRQFLAIESKSTAGHQRISMGAVTGFPIPLAPLDEQREIVRRVEALFAYADRLEARSQAARAHVARLTPALLAKAFRGELVPQDPNDEPASALLERIRGARAATSPRVGSAHRSRTQVEPKAVVRAHPTATGDAVRRPSEQKCSEGGVPPQSVSPRNITEAILTCLQPGREYSRGQVCEALGLSPSEWNWAIWGLKESGKVEQAGERRGARYRINR